MHYQKFIRAFLISLGCHEVQFHNESENAIKGKAVYTDLPETEYQEFIFYKKPNSINENLLELINLIKDNNLLSGDKLNCSKEKLFEMFKQSREATFEFSNFNKLLQALFNIRIIMLNNESETDSYLIHE